MHECLRRYWPPEGQILLLIAALADLETARRAWRQWDAGQDLADAAWAEVCLLAAIAHRMRALAPGAAPDPRLVGARRYIWTQTQMTLGTVRPLLAALQAEGLRLMLMKGAARLSTDPTLAQDRALRDIDVLIHPADWERGVGIARREGWVGARQKDTNIDNLRHRHAIGLRSPIPGARGEFDLHRHALAECVNEGQDLDLWDRALPVRFLDVDVLRPAPTDFALVTLGQSLLYGASNTGHWALDVDPLIRAGQIDWDLLLHEARRRRIEPYIAAPLLMLRERIGSPVPLDILRALTQRLSSHSLTEFETRTTGYGARNPAQFEARRIVASARAMRIARDQPCSATPLGQTSPRVVRHARLKPGEEIAIPVPTGATSFARLRLHLSFDVHHARGHAYLKIEGPGLALKMIPVERASKARGGRVRRHVVILCPACLFALRGIDHVRVRTNDRVEIRNMVASWGRPVPFTRLDRLAAAVRRWRGT
ncbi:nucleotidyltransferase family protein [Dongia deserti]|uniref:nucleotidyltransferase family protein n=1 Tax=Dongia deserti TaxID=2268030 RepID=UPI000E655C23|nr:nucleotidyltransferase family protein [Dongia deserti]